MFAFLYPAGRSPIEKIMQNIDISTKTIIAIRCGEPDKNRGEWIRVDSMFKTITPVHISGTDILYFKAQSRGAEEDWIINSMYVSKIILAKEGGEIKNNDELDMG